MAKKGSIGNKSTVALFGPIDASFKPGQPLGITFEFNKSLGTLCIAEFVQGSVAPNFGLKIGMHLTHIDNDNIVDIPQNLVIEILKRKSNFSRKLTFKFLHPNSIIPITTEIDQYQVRSSSLSQKVNLNVHHNLPPLRPSLIASDSSLTNNHSKNQNVSCSTTHQLSELPKIVRPNVSGHLENTINNSNTNNMSHHSQSSSNIKLSRLSTSQNQTVIRRNKGIKRNNNEDDLLDPYSTPARRRRIIADVTMFLLRQYCLKACDNVLLFRKQTTAALKIQCMIRIVFAKAIRFALHHLKCQNCALLIQTQWRIFLAKSKVSHKRMVVNMKRAKVLALSVQGAWRSYISRQVLSKLRQERNEQQQLIRLSATRLLQRVERGRRGRFQARKKRLERQKYQQRLHQNCTRIQSQYRLTLAQRQVQLLRQRKAASLTLYNCISIWWKRHRTARHAASVKITRWMKRYLQARGKSQQRDHSAMHSLLNPDSTFNESKIEPLIYEVHVPIPQSALTSMMADTSQMVLDWCIRHGFITSSSSTSPSPHNDHDYSNNNSNSNNDDSEEVCVYMIGDVLLLATSMAIQSDTPTGNSSSTSTAIQSLLHRPQIQDNNIQTNKAAIDNDSNSSNSHKEAVNQWNSGRVSVPDPPATSTSRRSLPVPVPLPPLILKHDREIEIIINANNLISYFSDINNKTPTSSHMNTTTTSSAIIPTTVATSEIFVKLFLFSEEALVVPSTPPSNIEATAGANNTAGHSDSTRLLGSIAPAFRSPSTSTSTSSSTFSPDHLTVVLPASAPPILISQRDFISAAQNQSQSQSQPNANDSYLSNINSSTGSSIISRSTIPRNEGLFSQQRQQPMSDLKGGKVKQSRHPDNRAFSHTNNIEISNFLTACTAIGSTGQKSRVRNTSNPVNATTAAATALSSRRNSFVSPTHDALVGVAPKKYPRVSADAFLLLPQTTAASAPASVEGEGGSVGETGGHETVSLTHRGGEGTLSPSSWGDEEGEASCRLPSLDTNDVMGDGGAVASQYSDRIKRIFRFWNGKVLRRKILTSIIRIQNWFRRLLIMQKFQHLVLLVLHKMLYALTRLQSRFRGYRIRRKIPFIRRSHCHQLLDIFYEIHTNRIIANNRLNFDRNNCACINPIIDNSESNKIKYATSATVGYAERPPIQLSNKLTASDNANIQCSENWDQNIIHILGGGDRKHSNSSNTREGNNILNSSYNLHAVLSTSKNQLANIVNNLQSDDSISDDNFGDVDISIIDSGANDDSHDRENSGGSETGRHILHPNDVHSTIKRTNNFSSMLSLRYPPTYNNLSNKS